MSDTQLVLSGRTIFDQNLHLAFPPVVVQLLYALTEQAPSIEDVVRLVNMDSPIYGAVLSLANSQRYRKNESITDISRAIEIIGLPELFRLVLMLVMQKQMSSAVRRSAEARFNEWRINVWSALCAEEIAKRQAPKEAGSVYSAAMLKDLPQMFLYNKDDSASFIYANVIFMVHNEDMEESEKRQFGARHQDLVADLLQSWRIDKDFIEDIREHHNVNNLDALSPRGRCLALGTRWAELLHGELNDPASLIGFEANLRKLLDISEEHIERMRNVCAQRFATCLSILNIPDGAFNARYYDHEISVFHRLYSLGLEVQNTTSGISGLAVSICRQLKFYWGITSCELALRTGHSNLFTFFSMKDGKLSFAKRHEARFEDLPWTPGWESMEIGAPGDVTGCLRISRRNRQGGNNKIFPLYINFLSLALSNYYQNFLPLITQKAIIENFPIRVATLNKDGIFTDANQAFLRALRLTNIPEGMTIFNICTKYLHCDADISHDFNLFLYGTIRSLRLKVSGNEDSPAGLYLTVYRMASQENYFMLLIEEVTDALQAPMSALAGYELLQLFIRGNRSAVLLLDKDWNTIWSGKSTEQCIGKNFFEVLSPGSDYKGEWNCNGFKNFSPDTVLEAIYRHPGGNQYYEFTFHRHRIRNADVIMAIGADSTRYKKLEEKVRATRLNATQDPLTGFQMHSQFFITLEAECERAEHTASSVGVVFINLLDFKAFNARYGYRAGDNMLRLISGALITYARFGIDTFCRFSGTEFAMIIPNANKEMLASIANIFLNVIQGKSLNVIKAKCALTILDSKAQIGEAVEKAGLATHNATEAANLVAPNVVWIA